MYAYYGQMLAIAEHAEDNKKTLHRASTNLSSAVNLLNCLIRLTCDLSDKDFDILQSILCPNVADNGDQVCYLHLPHVCATATYNSYTLMLCTTACIRLSAQEFSTFIGTDKFTVSS